MRKPKTEWHSRVENSKLEHRKRTRKTEWSLSCSFVLAITWGTTDKSSAPIFQLGATENFPNTMCTLHWHWHTHTKSTWKCSITIRIFTSHRIKQVCMCARQPTRWFNWHAPECSFASTAHSRAALGWILDGKNCGWKRKSPQHTIGSGWTDEFHRTAIFPLSCKQQRGFWMAGYHCFFSVSIFHIVAIRCNLYGAIAFQLPHDR